MVRFPSTFFIAEDTETGFARHGKRLGKSVFHTFQSPGCHNSMTWFEDVGESIRARRSVTLPTVGTRSTRAALGAWRCGATRPDTLRRGGAGASRMVASPVCINELLNCHKQYLCDMKIDRSIEFITHRILI